MSDDATPDRPTPEANPKAQVTPARRTLWAVGLGVGGYMIIKGVYGLVKGEDKP
ncbi:MAG: hypothetical protein QM713_12890 [Arachnia sp.]